MTTKGGSCSSYRTFVLWPKPFLQAGDELENYTLLWRKFSLRTEQSIACIQRFLEASHNSSTFPNSPGLDLSEDIICMWILWILSSEKGLLPRGPFFLLIEYGNYSPIVRTPDCCDFRGNGLKRLSNIATSGRKWVHYFQVPSACMLRE